MWKEVNWDRWVRSDGAVVKWDDRSPHVNPAKTSCRMWTAWEPDPGQNALVMRRGKVRRAQDGHPWRPGFPRRWKTSVAAMKAVDREYPIYAKDQRNVQHGNLAWRDA